MLYWFQICFENVFCQLEICKYKDGIVFANYDNCMNLECKGASPF